MECVPTPLAGLVAFQQAAYSDARGTFSELWRQDHARIAGLPHSFVQDNVSWSQRGVLRGLHFQKPAAQGKLVRVLQGAVYDVAVDLRKNSPTFGKWYGLELSGTNHMQIYVPEGFAHGFQALTDGTIVLYKCTALYRPSAEHALRFDDPRLGIRWPIDDPVVSEKDRAGRLLAEVPTDWTF